MSDVSETVTVPFTLGGTAVSGTAFSGVSAGPLVFPAGTTTEYLTGTLLSDPGPSQTLTFTLGTLTGDAALASPSVNTLTITEPTPPTILGSPVPVKTNEGVTAISVGFDHPLNPASASNTTLYHVLEGVKKKGKTVYTKSLKVRAVSYVAATNSVTIRLARPLEGTAEVIVDGAIEAMDDTTSIIDASAIVK